MLYLIASLSWYFSRFNILASALKSIVLGIVAVSVYTAFAACYYEHSVKDILMLKIPFSDVSYATGLLMVQPLHLIGYIMICGGFYWALLFIIFDEKVKKL